MSEKLIVIDFVNPIEIFGANHSLINQIINSFPKLKIVVRGENIKVTGDEDEILNFENILNLLIKHHQKNKSIDENFISQLLNSSIEETSENLKIDDDVLVFSKNGTPIKARTINQRKLVESSLKNDLIFAIGPAGTGKTYTAVALAVRALKNKETKKIILTRPAVEAGENLGFLPGDLKDKLDPYLQPLFDALRDMIPPQKLSGYIEDGTIQIAPLAYMRGRTLDNAVAILDEAQNASENQLKMFLTRMGKSAKFFVTGDITQIDLPKSQSSGLTQAMRILKNVNGIDFIFLDERDIVRHKLVSKIVDAYKKDKN
jgi:phosphate starvation-inducible PhoH-like protein